MTTILVASTSGFRAYSETGQSINELPGRQVGALAKDANGECLAIVDGTEIWRRSSEGNWTLITTAGEQLESIVSIHKNVPGAKDAGTMDDGTMDDGAVDAGAMDVGTVNVGTRSDGTRSDGARHDGARDADPTKSPAGKIIASAAGPVMLRMNHDGTNRERLTGFDSVAGRETWYGQGPPLHTRSLTATCDSSSIMAAVHVGGIPRSTDSGITWQPTVPIDFDVHEVRAHPFKPLIVAAATAVGLCLSEDGGKKWKVYAEGPEDPHALAVAFHEDDVLFSAQDGPFASRSQIWQLNLRNRQMSHVTNGLPDWLEGKVDSSHLCGGNGNLALVDGAGTLWLSQHAPWRQVASSVGYVLGMLIL